MKKVVSLLIALILMVSSTAVFALDIDEAYQEFKSAHPEFINSMISGGIEESVIISFISDVYDYLMEIDSYTPITEENFESNVMRSIMDVSSREAYYPLQDALIILYPEAIKIGVTQNKISPEFQPLANTIKAIFFRDDNSSGNTGGGNSGTGGGNSGNTGNNTPIIENSNTNTPSVTIKNNPFSDVPESHWAFNAVTSLAEKYILNGYYDGTFKPENNITRGEFAKIIVSATKSFDVNAESSFSDVSKDDWYYSYVSTAFKLGYITGYPDGTFKPEANISRADICTIVNRVLKANPDGSVSAFTDDWSIPSYARDSVYALAAKGIINGYSDGSFNPTAQATRAQTAKIIYSAFLKN